MNTETIEYRGIVVNIENDTDPINPFEDHDGHIPMITSYDGLVKDYSDGDIQNYLEGFLDRTQYLDKFQDQKILVNKMIILLDMIGMSLAEFEEEYPAEDYDQIEFLKDDLIPEWLEESIDNKVTFCESFGLRHYRGNSTGYSQGDWSDVFMVWTTAFGEETGRSHISMRAEDFEAQFKLFGAWAWGDCYFYTIDATNGDSLDSCGGFYGTDWENNGVLEYARNAIDCYLEEKRKEKQKKLKALIINRVDLAKRSIALQTA